MPPKYQEQKVMGPATALAVAPGASAIIATIQPPPDVDVWFDYYGIDIGNVANQNFATFNFLVNGSIYRSDNTAFGSIRTPVKLGRKQKLGTGCQVQVQGVMGAGAAGNTDMACICGLIFTKPGDDPNV
jgi:hypothetical protein